MSIWVLQRNLLTNLWDFCKYCHSHIYCHENCQFIKSWLQDQKVKSRIQSKWWFSKAVDLYHFDWCQASMQNSLNVCIHIWRYRQVFQQMSCNLLLTKLEKKAQIYALKTFNHNNWRKTMLLKFLTKTEFSKTKTSSLVKTQNLVKTPGFSIWQSTSLIKIPYLIHCT